MRITADTNVLVRAIVADDAKQAKLAQGALEKAECVAVTASVLCELVWVLSRGYGREPLEIGRTIRQLVASKNVQAGRPAIEAGLVMLDAGGDFADGLIAFEGAALGGDIFTSFDKEAVKLLKQQGGNAQLLG